MKQYSKRDKTWHTKEGKIVTNDIVDTSVIVFMILLTVILILTIRYFV